MNVFNKPLFKKNRMLRAYPPLGCVSKNKGFTLIEIALVLTIISLLIGGILRGQSMIRNTKVKTLYNQYRELVAAVTVYQDRFHFLPGDDLQASSRFTVPTNSLPTVSNGNGNGVIDGAETLAQGASCGAGVTGNEACQAFYHLRLAGIMSGQDTVSPAHSFGGGLLLSKTSAFITGWNSPTSVCYQGLTADVLRDMENLYDDRIASAGSLRGGTDYMAGSADSLAGTVCMMF
jgi:prepilin-type N-terminal cleavage/methylation domain-containing protein